MSLVFMYWHVLVVFLPHYVLALHEVYDFKMTK